MTRDCKSTCLVCERTAAAVQLPFPVGCRRSSVVSRALLPSLETQVACPQTSFTAQLPPSEQSLQTPGACRSRLWPWWLKTKGRNQGARTTRTLNRVDTGPISNTFSWQHLAQQEISTFCQVSPHGKSFSPHAAKNCSKFQSFCAMSL